MPGRPGLSRRDGLMMWFMMRGMHSQPAAATADDVELSRMRAEIDQLRAAQHDSAAQQL